jgi:hypothetical protein
MGGREANRPDTPRVPANRPTLRIPKICKVSFTNMDTSRLLLAFLAFGAACTTLWAWMVASAGSPSSQGE